MKRDRTWEARPRGLPAASQRRPPGDPQRQHEQAPEERRRLDSAGSHCGEDNRRQAQRRRREGEENRRLLGGRWFGGHGRQTTMTPERFTGSISGSNRRHLHSSVLFELGSAA
jgi:hypothetical protein